jgi:hypothetical protein
MDKCVSDKLTFLVRLGCDETLRYRRLQATALGTLYVSLRRAARQAWAIYCDYLLIKQLETRHNGCPAHTMLRGNKC